MFERSLLGKMYDEVADHMIKVATITCEGAMWKAKRKNDVSHIVAIEREELELMREKAPYMSDNVENNIFKLHRKTQERLMKEPTTPISTKHKITQLTL